MTIPVTPPSSTDQPASTGTTGTRGPNGALRFSPSISWFLVIFGVWSWVIWPTFMVNISEDPRAFTATGSPTAFFLVHLVIAVVSFVLGTIIGTLGIRGLLALRRAKGAATQGE